MHLLVVTSNPDRASFRYRIGMYLDLLRGREIDSTVVRMPSNPLARRAMFASACRSDGILFQRGMLTAWDEFWLRRYRGTVLYDFDDAIMYADEKPTRHARARSARFGRSVALSHLVIAGNDYLAEHARRYNVNVRVLPTGLDLRPYRHPPLRRDDGTVRLVWIGSRNTLRYLREIGPALDEIGRRFPHVVLRTICDESFELNAIRVEKRRWSKDTEVADLIGSDIGLAPLPDNRFTRGKCGFKILQYQAAGLPVIASPVGVNTRYVQDGKTGFLAHDPAQWVNTLAALVENPELRTTLGRAGRHVVEDFDIGVVGASFCRFVEECLRSRM